MKTAHRVALFLAAGLLLPAACTNPGSEAPASPHAAAHEAPKHAAHDGAPASAQAAGVRTLEAEDHAAALLQRLVAARGVSGREGPVRDVVAAELHRIDPSWRPCTDDAGNLWLELPGGNCPDMTAAAGDAPPVVFIAHMDEIGLQVTDVRADGLLETKGLGGFHDHLYRGTAIELVTATGKVLPGIALPAPAAEPKDAAASSGRADAAGAASAGGASSAAGSATARVRYVVDVGAHDAAGVAALGVAVGDTATVPKELLRLGRHRVAGRSNDDRVGCASLLLALEDLVARSGGAQLDRPAIFIWSTREEVGLEGADAAARALRPVPSVVYAVDTFVTSDSPREDPHYAFARLGDGPVLRALDNSSITPPATLARVRAIAAQEDVPLQMGTMGGGNDGSRFVPEGATDCPLAWPQRNSHSRVETLDLRDLVELSRLVAALARED